MGDWFSKVKKSSKKYASKEGENNSADMEDGKANKYGEEYQDDGTLKRLLYEPGNIDHINYISAFEESSKFMWAVNNKVQVLSSKDGSVLSTLDHPKQVTKCFAFNDDASIVTLCRDSIVRVFSDFNSDSTSSVEFKGHQLSVTSGCLSLGENTLATGGRDYHTMLWDVETQKCEHKNRIDRNMVTDMKWMPNDNNTFVQTSEDLRMRFFDIREGLEVSKATLVGGNFAANMDIGM